MRRPLLLVILLLVFAACGVGTGSVRSPLPGGKADGTVDPARVVSIVVHYPAGYGHRIAVRGDSPLSWDEGVDLDWSEGDHWKMAFEADGPVALKPLFDDVEWAIGPDWIATPGTTLDVWPRFFTRNGLVVVTPDWWSNTLGNARAIRVYLPPSYDENPDRAFPVVYLHDGQNLFPGDANFGGQSWEAAAAMDGGAASGAIREAILVGIDNTDARMSEYTPTADPDYGGGGGGAYLAFVIDEVRPWVDATYRTLEGPASTGILGSSLGGLISAYAGVRRPDVFGLIGVLSPSTWWDGRMLVNEVGSIPYRDSRALRVYVDTGDTGAEDNHDCKPDTDVLVATYRDVGYRDDVDFRYVVQPGADHNEYWWAQRLPGALAFLLGAR